MSTASHVELALRKARLLERIGTQREQLAAQADVLNKPFALADKALQAMQYVKGHPWTAGVAVFAAVVLGRGSLLRWAGRGWTVWRTWRLASRWLHAQGYLKS
jgi:ElaB/YqjD/DUF883 family membrane-anchored ribosome-binding protein